MKLFCKEEVDLQRIRERGFLNQGYIFSNYYEFATLYFAYQE